MTVVSASGRRTWAARLLAGVLVLAALVGALVLGGRVYRSVCDPASPAVAVDPAAVPARPVLGFGRAQLVNAATIMLAAAELELTVRDQQIGVMTAMGESSLRVLDRGDAAGPDSRGLFQQGDNGDWRSYADRMDPFTSATNFFAALARIEDRRSLDAPVLASLVQGNADPDRYRSWEGRAGAVVQALGGAATAASRDVVAASVYALGPVQPVTTTLANVLGPRFGIATVGGYRDPGTERYDPNGHPAGLAVDFLIDDVPGGQATGDRLAAYAVEHHDDLSVRYVIWRQRIWSAQRASEGWRPMEDRGSRTQNHEDHVHVSLTADVPFRGCPGA